MALGLKRGHHVASSSTDASYVDFSFKDANSLPTQNRNRIPSPFTYLRNRKKSGDSKTLTNSRSIENFHRPVDVRASVRALPPVPRLPSDGSVSSTGLVPLRSGSGSEYLTTSSSANSSVTFSPPQSGQPFPQFPEPTRYDDNSGLVSAGPLVPLRRNSDEPNQQKATFIRRTGSPEQMEPTSPMERTLNQALDRHGVDLVNSATIFDRQVAQNLVLANSMKQSHADAKVAAKLGKMLFVGTQHLSKAQTLLDAAAASAVWNTSKQAAETLLQPAKELLPILDLVTQYLPVLIIAKSVFSAIIKVELDRHENDKNVAIVYFTMTTFWFTLCDLEVVFHATENLKETIGAYLKEVMQSMNDFGNFRDLYYKHGHMTRVIRSASYKEKLLEFTQRFKDHKDRLHEILTQHTSLTVTKMNQTVDSISAKFDMVIEAMNSYTPLEARVMSKITEIGGEDRAVQNTRFLHDLADNYFREQLTPQIKTALRTNLDELLKSNLAMYELKVEAAKRSIEKAVERSTDSILMHLESGPHNLIEDEDIRDVWKNMNWRISCKARHFVDAVHQHFAHKFSRHRHEASEPHPDEWTLKFLGKVIFQPTIGDAIDEDGTGYISVHEVNHFFKSRPDGWSSPQWLSFCADGWYQNNILYRDRCMALLRSIENSARRILPHNRKPFKPYMKRGCLPDVWLIVNSINTDSIKYRGDQDYTSLDPLRRRVMDMEIKRIESNLEHTRYQLDTPEGVCAVMGSTRTEVFALCLLSLLLERHSKVIELAEYRALSDREFETMVSSIHNVALAFGIRYSNLAEGWRQQRQDTTLQVQCFASGIFESWHMQYSETPYDLEYPGSPPQQSRLTVDYFDSRSSSSDEQAKVTNAEDLLLYALPPQPTPEELKKFRAKPKGRRPMPEQRSSKALQRVKTKSRNSRLHPQIRTPTKTTPTRTHAQFEWPDPLATRRQPSPGRKMFYQFEFESAHDAYASGDSSDMPEVSVMQRKSKIPKMEDRIRSVESELSTMKDMLSQLLTLSQKEKGLRVGIPAAPTFSITPP